MDNLKNSVRSHLGLPLLTEEAYLMYWRRLGDLRTEEDVARYFDRIIGIIQEEDPLYFKFIEGASQMYPGPIGINLSRRDLALGYQLLSSAGDLPKLGQEKFDKRWTATMNRVVAMLNVGCNMDIIRDDNPLYWGFIMDTARCYPASGRIFVAGPNMFIMSDLSCGYMFLADNVKSSEC